MRQGAQPDDDRDDDPEVIARQVVLDRLTGAARSRAQLADALAARGTPDNVARRVLDRFEEVGLVDDSAFAAAWVRDRQERRGLSRRALAHELRARGIDGATAAEALASVDPQVERAAAERLVVSRLRSMAAVSPSKRYGRLAGMLARKGYPSELTAEVLRKVLGDEVSGDEALGDEFDADDG
jgi:regulatory protein